MTRNLTPTGTRPGLHWRVVPPGTTPRYAAAWQRPPARPSGVGTESQEIRAQRLRAVLVAHGYPIDGAIAMLACVVLRRCGCDEAAAFVAGCAEERDQEIRAQRLRAVLVAHGYPIDGAIATLACVVLRRCGCDEAAAFVAGCAEARDATSESAPNHQ